MKLLLVCLLMATTLCAEPEDQAVKRIYAYLLVHDAESAVAEAKKALVQFPESKEIEQALIRSLADKGEEIEALAQWNHFQQAYPEEKKSLPLLESLSWGVLHKADSSSLWMVRLFAIIGASITQDVRAVSVLADALSDSNAYIRSVAIQFSSRLRDHKLQQELLRLLKEEKVWHVRLQIMTALGQQQLTSAIPLLQEIIANPKSSAEEKETAICSLVSIMDRAEERELLVFFKSPRAGLRELACELAAHFDCTNRVEDISLLLQDSSPDVRRAALNALTLLKATHTLQASIHPLLDDSAPEVAITAAWAAVLCGDKEGEKKLRGWIVDSRESYRHLAAGAIKALGKKGIPLATSLLDQSDDLYVRLNLALGLIGQRVELAKAQEVLFAALSSSDDKPLWMWNHSLNPLFERLTPSTLSQTEQMANYPSVVDQLARLDLLSLLTQLNHPKALDAIKAFLHSQNSHVSGIAAFALLSEGDKEALDLVQQLLVDKEEKIRLEAAFLLTLFRRDKEAVDILKSAYPHAEREEKIRILETLGHLGDENLIPFFLERLQEPYQTLRVAAAASLIQTLYH